MAARETPLRGHPKLRDAVLDSWQEVSAIEDPVERAKVVAWLTENYSWADVEASRNLRAELRAELAAEAVTA